MPPSSPGRARGRRREPVRTCIGCRTTAPKPELVRLVRSPDGTISVDGTGKAPGRGAYVHRDPRCLEAATRKGALARALRADIDPEELATLRSDIDRTGATQR